MVRRDAQGQGVGEQLELEASNSLSLLLRVEIIDRELFSATPYRALAFISHPHDQLAALAGNDVALAPSVTMVGVAIACLNPCSPLVDPTFDLQVGERIDEVGALSHRVDPHARAARVPALAQDGHPEGREAVLVRPDGSQAEGLPGRRTSLPSSGSAPSRSGLSARRSPPPRPAVATNLTPCWSFLPLCCCRSMASNIAAIPTSMSPDVLRKSLLLHDAFEGGCDHFELAPGGYDVEMPAQQETWLPPVARDGR